MKNSSEAGPSLRALYISAGLVREGAAASEVPRAALVQSLVEALITNASVPGEASSADRTRPSGSCISLDRPVCLGGMPKCPSDRGVSLRDLPEDLKIPPRFFRGPVDAMSAWKAVLSRFRLLISRGLFQSETCLSASVTAAFLCVTYPRIVGACPSLPVTVTDFGMLTA